MKSGSLVYNIEKRSFNNYVTVTDCMPFVLILTGFQEAHV